MSKVSVKKQNCKYSFIFVTKVFPREAATQTSLTRVKPVGDLVIPIHAANEAVYGNEENFRATSEVAEVIYHCKTENTITAYFNLVAQGVQKPWCSS